MGKIKTWVIRILLALVALLAIILRGRKPKWVEEKKKAVDGREKTIENAEKQADRSKNYYEEMKKNHDEEIKQAGEIPDSPDFDNVDDAADYLRDSLSKHNRR